MEVKLNGETHFRFGMKDYIINKLPMILLEVLIFIVIDIIFYIMYSNSGFNMQDYNIYIWSLRQCMILIVVLTILKYIININLHKKELLIISREKTVQLHRERIHSIGKDWDAYTWSSNEHFYVKNIQGFYEGLLSFVIYGDVEFVKTQKDGSIKKIYKDKLVIKKIFEKNNEIRELLNEITDTKKYNNI